MAATAKDELMALIEQLSEDDAVQTLAYARWLVSEDEPLTDEELAFVAQGEQQIAAGNYVTLTELRRSLST